MRDVENDRDDVYEGRGHSLALGSVPRPYRESHRRLLFRCVLRLPDIWQGGQKRRADLSVEDSDKGYCR